MRFLAMIKKSLAFKALTRPIFQAHLLFLRKNVRTLKKVQLWIAPINKYLHFARMTNVPNMPYKKNRQKYSIVFLLFLGVPQKK